MAHGVQIEFADGASWIWHHHDFRLQQDRPQGPLRLEYGNFPPEMLEVEDPEFMVGLGRRLPKRPRFLSLGLAFLAVLIVPAAIYWVENRHWKKWLHVYSLQDLNMIFRLK